MRQGTWFRAMFAAKTKRQKAYKIITTALAFAIIATAVGLFVGFSTYGVFSPRHIFLANILLGAFFSACGIWIMIFPSFDKKSILEDSTTYTELSSDRRTKKYKKGYDFLFLGLAIGAFGVILEFLVWVVV